MVNNFREKIEKCLVRIAVKNANSTSSLCFYEPDIPMPLKDVMQEKHTKTESHYHIKEEI